MTYALGTLDCYGRMRREDVHTGVVRRDDPGSVADSPARLHSTRNYCSSFPIFLYTLL